MKQTVTRARFVYLTALFVLVAFVFLIYFNYLQLNNEPLFLGQAYKQTQSPWWKILKPEITKTNFVFDDRFERNIFTHKMHFCKITFYRGQACQRAPYTKYGSCSSYESCALLKPPHSFVRGTAHNPSDYLLKRSLSSSTQIYLCMCICKFQWHSGASLLTKSHNKIF